MSTNNSGTIIIRKSLKHLLRALLVLGWMATAVGSAAEQVPATPGFVDADGGNTIVSNPAAKPSITQARFVNDDSGIVLAKKAGGAKSASLGVTRLTNVSTESIGGGVSVTLESSGMLQYTAFKLQKPLRLVMDFPKTTQGVLKSTQTIGKGVVDSLRPIYFQEAEVLRLEFALNQTASYEILRPEANKLVINFQPARQSSRVQLAQNRGQMVGSNSGAMQNNSQRSGMSSKMASFSEDNCLKILGGEKERISLDFQNARIVNIFRILSEVGGFNVILSPNVKGSTNIRLVDVPWNQAMELILKNNGLGKQCFGNIVRLAPQTTLAAEEKARKTAKQEKKLADMEERLAGELETEIISVNYAALEELTKSLDNLKSERGRITADPRTNTLIITDINDNLLDMMTVVRTLDIPTRQVMIEARIVEVNRNASKDLGIQWGGSFNGSTNNEFPATINAGSSTNTTDDFIVDLPNAGSLLAGNAAGVGLSLGSLSKDFILDLQISALEEQGLGRTLSSPKVTTLDNREAKIQSGRKIPYATVSQDGTRIEFVDATIELTVTPHITADQNVLMTIQAKKNAADFTNNIDGVPTITTKEAFTEVLVADSETTVLGGLYENAVNNSTSKVPFFADIPVLGYLFKNFSDLDTVDELLIFITPTIVLNQ